MEHPGCEYAYVALTRLQAKRIAWTQIIRDLDRKYKMGLVLKEAELRVILPNESAISLYGADRDDWMVRLYGQKLRKVAIDEAAFYEVDLNTLVHDIVEPTITDLRGQVTLCSRPGNICRGYFYEICQGEHPDWSVHRWTVMDNPYVREAVTEQLARKKKANPDIESEPSFRRNWLGEWVSDEGQLVYKYKAELNALAESPDFASGWTFALGVDLGWFDPTAFVVIAWHPNVDHMVVVESESHTEMLLDETARIIRQYQDDYPGLLMVGDPGRRQAFEELCRRYDLPIMPAEKHDKGHRIDQLNNDLLAGKVKFLNPGRQQVVKEMQELIWKVKPNGQRVEEAKTENDCCDALLYVFDLALHYRAKPKPKEPSAEDQMWERVAEQYDQRNKKPWWS